jgi:hypothetical protein
MSQRLSTRRSTQEFSSAEASLYAGLANQLLAGAPPSAVPAADIHPLHAFLQVLLIDCVKAQEYLQAQRIEDVCTALLQQKTESSYESYQSTRLKLLEERYSAALKCLDEARRALGEMQAKLEQERADALANLSAEHKRELAQFEQSHCQEMPASFRKYSSRYLLLRKRQEVCVQSKRFAEADALKKEADEIERIENARQEENWMKSVALQRDAVLQKQMQQIHVLEEKFEGRWSEIMPPLLQEVTRAENAVKAAELKLATLQSADRPQPMKTGPSRGAGTRMRIVNYALKMGKVKHKPVRKLWVNM